MAHYRDLISLAAELDFNVSRKEGEFRICPADGGEDVAYYTDDLADAINTMRAMALPTPGDLLILADQMTAKGDMRTGEVRGQYHDRAAQLRSWAKAGSAVITERAATISASYAEWRRWVA